MQKDNNGIEQRKIKYFLEDCWDTIINNAKYDYIAQSIEFPEDPDEEEDRLYKCWEDYPSI